MVAVTSTETPGRSIHQLILGVGSLLIALGYFSVDYPPLFTSAYVLIGVLSLLKYSSTRVRELLHTHVSKLASGAFWTGFVAVLFWRYGYRSWAIGSSFLSVVLSCGWFVRRVQNR